jgi:hypothetical protein
VSGKYLIFQLSACNFFWSLYKWPEEATSYRNLLWHLYCTKTLSCNLNASSPKQYQYAMGRPTFHSDTLFQLRTNQSWLLLLNTAIILFRWYVYTIQDDISQLYYCINVLKTMTKSFNVKDSISIKHITVVFIKGGN